MFSFGFSYLPLFLNVNDTFLLTANPNPFFSKKKPYSVVPVVIYFFDDFENDSFWKIFMIYVFLNFSICSF